MKGPIGWAGVVCAAAAIGLVACGGPIAADTSEPDLPDTAPPAQDGGTQAPPDGGTAEPDAGTPETDGGTPELDGGTTEPDAGTPPQSALCVPTAGGPYWLVEGDPVSFTVSCSKNELPHDPKFEVVNLPEGATFDGTTFSWTPRLNQAATWMITVRELGTQETAEVKLGVADRFESPNNSKVSNPETYLEEFGLPVMHLFFEGSLGSDYKPARLVYRGHTYALQAKYRGATSRDFPKRSMTLKFPDDDEFEDHAVGFGNNRDKLALITSFNDNSYVRPRLAFELWRRMDKTNLGPSTFPVVVFVNGYYRGVYTAADLVDGDLMKMYGLPKDGHLFKSFHADANFSAYTQEGVEKWAYWQGYEKKEGFPEEDVNREAAMKPIGELTEFVARSTPEVFRDQLDERVHLRSYENWWIFNTLILGTDSAAKNAYHYQLPTGGPFRYIPWDLDASFGQDWDTRRTSAQWRNDFRERSNLWARMLDEPALINPIRARYPDVLTTALPKAEVLALYDQLQDEVRDAARRDELRWRDEYRAFERWNTRTDFTTYDQEAKYVRDWIDERWDALLRQVP